MQKFAGLILLYWWLSVFTVMAQYNSAKTDAWLAANAPGMGGRVVLVVWKNGRVIYSNAVNEMTIRQKFVYSAIAKRTGKTADLANFTPSKKEPIASCSKWLSAALVMTFVDEGKLKLDDTVGKYLPVLSKHGKGAITIGECLSHLTGIVPQGLMENYEEHKTIGSTDDAIEQIANMQTEGKPGLVFHYSSVGLEIVGAVLEKISGKTFKALFAERIAGPLDMKDTNFGDATVPDPAGSGYSTAMDYINFLEMILNKGVFNDKRILSERSINQMQVNRCTADVKVSYKPEGAESFGYGYGEWVMDGNSVGSPGLFGSFPWIDNEKKYAAFMMTYYLKSGDKSKRYLELKQVVDSSIGAPGQ